MEYAKLCQRRATWKVTERNSSIFLCDTHARHLGGAREQLKESSDKTCQAISWSRQLHPPDLDEVRKLANLE